MLDNAEDMIIDEEQGTKEDGYLLHLPVFDGPFDLLLHLIRENEVDIYDIPIAEITSQYLAYLHAMEELDLEIASGFIVMAATLLAIKARMLIPQQSADDDIVIEEDAREELVRDILEYVKYKDAAASLNDLRKVEIQRFSRPNEEELYVNFFAEENPLSGKTLTDLHTAFARAWQRASAIIPCIDIERKQITVKDKQWEIVDSLRDNAKGISLDVLFSPIIDKEELIITFLALLELARCAMIRIAQSAAYGEIYLFPGDNLGQDGLLPHR